MKTSYQCMKPKRSHKRTTGERAAARAIRRESSGIRETKTQSVANRYEKFPDSAPICGASLEILEKQLAELRAKNNLIISKPEIKTKP